ncbi:MAG: conjugal transfer protein TraO [Burkholderiales bacterium]|nr:conjugal transfer protein TraO [Burkholderiales bacterium]
MKQRLLVMNGQKLVQNEVDGTWKTIKVTKAPGLKAGIYNIYLAKEAETANHSYEGLIIHVDKDFFYQKSGNEFIKHSSKYFLKLPEVGKIITVRYDNEATQTNETIPAKTRKLSH